MIGLKVPDVKFYIRERDSSNDLNEFKWFVRDTEDYFANKRVVVFSLPGAFTPTCSTYQLPGFEEKYNHLVRQYEELVDEYNINKLVYESDINFKPLIGNVYYLYEKEDGRRFISILSFNETRWAGYLGAFRLKTQYTWEKID